MISQNPVALPIIAQCYRSTGTWCRPPRAHLPLLVPRTHQPLHLPNSPGPSSPFTFLTPPHSLHLPNSQVDEILQVLQRDINCLHDGTRFAKRKALERISAATKDRLEQVQGWCSSTEASCTFCGVG